MCLFTGSNTVLCPHCHSEIEIHQSGVFKCPFCHRGFQHEMKLQCPICSSPLSSPSNTDRDTITCTHCNSVHMIISKDERMEKGLEELIGREGFKFSFSHNIPFNLLFTSGLLIHASCWFLFTPLLNELFGMDSTFLLDQFLITFFNLMTFSSLLSLSSINLIKSLLSSGSNTIYTLTQNVSCQQCGGVDCGQVNVSSCAGCDNVGCDQISSPTCEGCDNGSCSNCHYSGLGCGNCRAPANCNELCTCSHYAVTGSYDDAGCLFENEKWFQDCSEFCFPEWSNNSE